MNRKSFIIMCHGVVIWDFPFHKINYSLSSKHFCLIRKILLVLGLYSSFDTACLKFSWVINGNEFSFQYKNLKLFGTKSSISIKFTIILFNNFDSLWIGLATLIIFLLIQDKLRNCWFSSHFQHIFLIKKKSLLAALCVRMSVYPSVLLFAR